MRYVSSLSNALSKKASRLIFGCTTSQMLAGSDVNALLDEAFESGITMFDTAEAYGLSECSLGNWISSRGNREDIVIITKGCHPRVNKDGSMGPDRMSPECLIEDIEQSLRRLNTDYIDIYLLHRDNLGLSVGPIIESLNSYYRAGKIKEFGVSNWSSWRIEAANEYASSRGLKGISVSSPNFGLCVQEVDPWGGGSGCVSISGSEKRSERSWYKKNQIPIFAYSAVGHGMLSGKVKWNDLSTVSFLDSPARKAYFSNDNLERLHRCEILAQKYECTVPQIAISWVLSQDEVMALPIVSTSKMENVKANVKALDIELTSSEVAWLNLE